MQGGTRFAAPAQVSYWHKADIRTRSINVRYGGKADMDFAAGHVRMT
jgi:hypothetical protein